MIVVARNTKPFENPLRHLGRPETPYVLEWEVLESPKAAPSRPEDSDSLLALRRAEEIEL